MRLRSAAIAGLVLAAVCAGSLGAAQSDPANVMAYINGVDPERPVAGAEFNLRFQLVLAPLDEGVPSPPGPAPSTMGLEVPNGIVVLPPGAPDDGRWPVGFDCVSACPVDPSNGGNPTGLSGFYRLRAAAPGAYTVKITIASNVRPDPEPGNNEFSYVINVAAGGSVTTATTRAGEPVASPLLPRAGKPYALTLPLTRAGAPVKPTTVRCAATLKGKALRGAAAKLSGRARCTWKLPATSRGAQLKAKLTAVAGGKTFTASRTARVR
jgi:hypothetical protein